MKVLIVANYAKEHINKFHLSTIKAFKEKGWTVDVACKADAEVPYCDHLYNLPIERNPYRPQSVKAIRQLKKIIKEGQYDAVHCHTYAGKFVGILAAKSFRKDGLKIIYSAHGFQYYKGAPFYMWLIFLPIDMWLVSKVDILLTTNEEDFSLSKRVFRKTSVILKQYGAGLKQERFEKIGIKNRQQVRSILNIDQDATILIYVAELNDNKNQQMLIRTVKRLRACRKEEFHLLLVGPDHSNGAMDAYIHKEALSENVHCLGWRNDVADLIYASDIALASSIREGLGINLLEYMYCEVPVVATDNRGHREIIQNNENGVLVRINDDKEMAEAVGRILEDRRFREQLISNGMKTAAQYEDERIVDRLVGIYETYLKEI